MGDASVLVSFLGVEGLPTESASHLMFEFDVRTIRVGWNTRPGEIRRNLRFRQAFIGGIQRITNHSGRGCVAHVWFKFVDMNN